MGRIGVSYTDVAKVANHLQENGQNPTVDAVREVLRTGSRSTIGPYLKQWRDAQVMNIDNPSFGVSQNLLALIRGLSDRIQTEINIKIESVVKATEQQLASLQDQLHHMSTSNQNLLEEKIEMGQLQHNLQDQYSEILNRYHQSNQQLIKTQECLLQIKKALHDMYQNLEIKDSALKVTRSELENKLEQ